MNIFRLLFTSFVVFIAPINTHHLCAMDQKSDSSDSDMDLISDSELQDSVTAPTNTSAFEAEPQDSSSTNVDYTPYHDAEEPTDISVHQDSSSASNTTSSSSSSSTTNNTNATNTMSLAQFNEKKNLIETCWSLVRWASRRYPNPNHFSTADTVTDLDKKTKKAIYLVASYKECFSKELVEQLRTLYKTTLEQTSDFEELIIYAKKVVAYYDEYYGYKWFTLADDGSLINNYEKHILQDISQSAYLKRKRITANEKNKRDGASSSSSSSSITL